VHLSSALRGLFSADRGTSRLAEGYGAAGQPDEGLRQLDEATRHMDATQERWHEADVHRVRGQLDEQGWATGRCARSFGDE